MPMTAHDGEDAEQRHLDALVRALGPAAFQAVADPDVTEIYVNPSGAVFFDTRSRGRVKTAEVLRADQVYRFLNLVASSHGAVLTTARPQLQAELPRALFGGARLQGFVPPLAAGPCFNLRKTPAVVYSLDDYVAAGILTAAQREALAAGVAERRNILIAGGTGSGKTTLANAVLHQIAAVHPHDRIVILEDTVELQCAARDCVALRTTDTLSLKDLVKGALRSSPDRIVVGEVRDEAALDLCDAWETGHPGGCGTLHAETALGALQRLDRLAQRNNVPPQPDLVASAIDLVVVIAGGSRGRRVTQVAEVDGHDARGFHLHAVPGC
jgi:P-type conjugative transfer ATPase TrbB